MLWWVPQLSCSGRHRGPGRRTAPAGRCAPRPAAGREGGGVRNAEILENPNGIPFGSGPHLLLQPCRTSPWLHSPQKEKHLKVRPAKLLRKGLPAFCETSKKLLLILSVPAPAAVPVSHQQAPYRRAAGGARPLAHHAPLAAPQWHDLTWCHCHVLPSSVPSDLYEKSHSWHRERTSLPVLHPECA